MRVSMFSVLFLILAAALALPVSGQIVRVRPHVAASPYTAEFKLTHTQKLADGNTISGQSTEVIAVDAQRRRVTATTEISASGDHVPRTRVNVFDPVARSHSDWTLPGQRAMVVAMPVAGVSRGCSPNATRGDGVNMGPARAARPKPVIEDLGTDTFQGIEARGRRFITTVPAGEVGNEAPLVRTSEVWTAVEPTLAGLVVRETSDDPQSGRRTRELVNLDQREPDETSFQPPAGYEIVNKTATETSCSSETASIPQ